MFPPPPVFIQCLFFPSLLLFTSLWLVSFDLWSSRVFSMPSVSSRSTGLCVRLLLRGNWGVRRGAKGGLTGEMSRGGFGLMDDWVVGKWRQLEIRGCLKKKWRRGEGVCMKVFTLSSTNGGIWMCGEIVLNFCLSFVWLVLLENSGRQIAI